MWLKSAWTELSEVTIQKCFAKCGFSQVQEQEQTLSLTNDNDNGDNLQDIQPLLNGVTLEQFASYDNDTETSREVTSDTWEVDILLGTCEIENVNDSDSDKDETENSSTCTSDVPSHLKLLKNCDEMRAYGLFHNDTEFVEMSYKMEERVHKYMTASKTCKQVTIKSFFTQSDRL